MTRSPTTITTLPEQLRRSLTWDQGTELAQHAQLQIDTGIAGLLLRPAQPLAARHQREHQRPAAPVLPQGHRPVPLQRRRPRRRRRHSQQTAPQDPRLEDPRRGPRRAPTLLPTRQCCDDPLNSRVHGRHGPGGLRRLGIRQSMGRPGSALDNAVIESWHSTLEFELRSWSTLLPRPRRGPGSRRGSTITTITGGIQRCG